MSEQSTNWQGAIASSNDERHGQTHIQLRIPKQFHQEPIISNLITQYDLTVNITAALLSANAREDGWFDLELYGTTQQINSALVYLNDLNLEIWRDSDPQVENW
ncbi:MAG: ABC transporter [Leptolyngbyaceae cyanobacterium SL_7_1]|nr:ABC transporter [Leptolyngbyaceae cyanobacterium SM1_4_3]NJN87836.1 ABC transporter [Leptolyngbyaceae cyanobacterium SL_7_1]